MIKSLYYVVGALALFGVIAHRRQILAPDRGLWVLLMLGFLNLLLLFYLAARIGYVSERHTVLFVMLACVFAAAALEPLAVILAVAAGAGKTGHLAEGRAGWNPPRDRRGRTTGHA